MPKIEPTKPKVQPYPLGLMGAKLPAPHIENPPKQKKRKQEEQEAEEEDKGYVSGPLDPIFGQHRAFPVRLSAETKEDLLKPPADVNAYLSRVRRQAETMDVIAYVKRDASMKAEEENEEKEDGEEEYTEAEEESMQWHEEFMAGFIQRREQFAKISGTKEPINFEFPRTVKTWRAFMFNNDPNDDYAVSLDTTTILKLINYSTKWLSKNINDHFANWIILLLVIVPDVLEANDVSTLRSFAKKALRQRAEELNSHEEVMRSIISAVGAYFGQRDLLVGYLPERYARL